MIKKIKDFYETESKTTLIVYLVLRALVIACLILETLRGNWGNACLCVLTLILYLIPYFIDQKLKIDLPSALFFQQKFWAKFKIFMEYLSIGILFYILLMDFYALP